MGICSLSSRLGGILAPYLANLGPGYDHVPMLAFGLSSLVAGLAAVLLPETVGVTLPVTIEDAERSDNAPSVKDCLRLRFGTRIREKSGEGAKAGGV